MDKLTKEPPVQKSTTAMFAAGTVQSVDGWSVGDRVSVTFPVRGDFEVWEGTIVRFELWLSNVRARVKFARDGGFVSQSLPLHRLRRAA
jgi:hypothetical protein